MQFISENTMRDGAVEIGGLAETTRVTIRRNDLKRGAGRSQKPFMRAALLSIGALALAGAGASLLSSEEDSVPLEAAQNIVNPNASSLADLDLTTCSPQNPLLFEGRHNSFALTNPQTCETLMRAMPGPNQTVQFDDRITIRAYTQGGVKITMKVGDGEFVQDVPREFYRALLEGWLTTMDANQNPIPYAPAMYMYKQESALGANMGAPSASGSACGMGQTTIANFAQNLMETGDRVGLGTMRWNALKIEAGMNLRDRGRAITPESEMDEIGRIKSSGYVNYPRLVRNTHFREIFGTRCDDVTPGAILGAQNLAIQTSYIQNQVDRGRLHLPDGRTQVTLRDAYIRYVLQGNFEPLYNAIHRNPNISLDVLFAANGVYARNELFSKRVNGRRVPLRAREFYNSIPQRGFDDFYRMNIRGYESMNHDASQSYRFASDTPRSADITITPSDDPRAQFQTYARPNYDYVYTTVTGYDWHAANDATDDAQTQTAGTASAAPAVS